MVQCQHYWDELSKDREGHIYESERILDKLQGTSIEQKYSSILNISDFTGEDKVSEVATRINQTVFREKVLSNYDYKCAITEIDIPPPLVASHIMPWTINKEERLNPAKGICLSPLYDATFDKGYIGFDRNYNVILSNKSCENQTKLYFNTYFDAINGKKLAMPNEFKPD